MRKMNQKQQCTLENIESDLRTRVKYLRLLKDNFSEDHCRFLAFYDYYLQTHPIDGKRNMKKYLSVMREYYHIGEIPQKASRLSGQLGFLFKVYSGQPLSVDDCREGSRYHKAVCEGLWSVKKKLAREIPGWSELCRSLTEEFSDIDSTVIQNIILDETLELLGKDVAETNREKKFYR